MGSKEFRFAGMHVTVMAAGLDYPVDLYIEDEKTIYEIIFLVCILDNGDKFYLNADDISWISIRKNVKNQLSHLRVLPSPKQDVEIKT